MRIGFGLLLLFTCNLFAGYLALRLLVAGVQWSVSTVEELVVAREELLCVCCTPACQEAAKDMQSVISAKTLEIGNTYYDNIVIRDNQFTTSLPAGLIYRNIIFPNNVCVSGVDASKVHICFTAPAITSGIVHNTP